MLKRKSSKLMSGAGAVAIVASLGSMSTAAENSTFKKIGKWVGAGAGLLAGLPLARYIGKNVKDMVLNSYKGPYAKLIGTVAGVILSVNILPVAAFGGIVGEKVGEYIDRNKENQNSKVIK